MSPAAEAPSDLGDEDPVLLDQVIVAVAARQQLPDLAAEGLRDTAPHQRRQLLRPYAQVQVPKSKTTATGSKRVLLEMSPLLK